MCGITGFVGFDDEPLLRRMCAILTHRGPDEAGFFTAPGVGLAMRRLRVIDLVTGRQPMANEDGSVQVVFNGEIYNYQELTRELKQRGHVFSSTSDTETIVHLYEEHGLEFPSRLRGMFAIALWDAKRHRLVLVRDRIGEKPLFYRTVGPEIVFASEIKAILLRCRSRHVRAQALCQFLVSGYVPAPNTFYEGICKLPPGHILVYEEGKATVRPYWKRRCGPSLDLPFGAACEQLADRLDEIGRLCLKSDVEVGAFLSGGIDSSVVVALMRKHAAQVQTFAVGYSGSAAGFNELNYASQVAEALGTRHHTVLVGPYATRDLLPRMLWHYDEPHGEPTSVLVYLLSLFTKRRVTVALGGTGGDEVFLGYPRFAGIRVLHYYSMLPRTVREQVVERVVLRWPESTKGRAFSRRARRFVLGAHLPPAEAYATWVGMVHPDLRAQLPSASVHEAAEDPRGDAFVRAYLCDAGPGALLDRASDLDLETYLPEYQLAYMDRMSMAHGLEVRSPLCDYQLVDFVTSLPNSYRLRGTRGKHIFKAVAKQWIPAEIAERKKVGFDSPIGQWIKRELRDFATQFLSREHVERSGLLNYEAVQKVLTDHLEGRNNYSLLLWSLLAIEGWYRMYIEDQVVDGSAYELKDLRGATNGENRSATAPRTKDSAPLRTPAGARPADGNGIWPRVGWTRRHLWEGTPRTIRRILGPALGVIPQRFLLGKRFRDASAFLGDAQWWSRSQNQAYQLSAMRGICELAHAHSPFYRRTFESVGFAPAELRTVEDFARLPTIDRETLRAHLEEMRTLPSRAPAAEFVSTGSTGGVPVHFYVNADRSWQEYAHLISCWQRAGHELGMPLAVFRGRAVRPDSSGFRHEYDPLLRYHYYSAFHMTDGNMGRYLAHIATIGPCFLHVYPSSVAALARFIRRAGAKAPGNIRGIIAESETVYPEQRQMVEEVFGCRYFSCYGHSEKLVMAAECEFSTDYHVWPTYGYFELLDEQGRPVTTPGQRGEIVGTGFINTVVPFIRYRTGDYATYVGDHCEACGRQHALIRDIRGHRTQEMLVAVDGSEISWTALNMHDDTFLRVRQFQFYQDTPGQAVLRVVPAEVFGDEDQRRIQHNLGRKLDGRVTFAIELVESIPLSPRGKAVYVDQRIKEPHASEGPA